MNRCILIIWLTDWLIDWFIDWLTDWLIDWLIDWLPDSWLFQSEDIEDAELRTKKQTGTNYSTQFLIF